jgi:uncharacterized protein
MIVDCHTHWGDSYQGRDGLDPANWLSVWDSHGVTHGVVMPIEGLVNAARIAQDNDNIAAVCARSGGRMIPFGSVLPAAGPAALTELERCLGVLKLRGVKFHPWLQGISIMTPEMDRICELAASYGVPILLHDGTPPNSMPAQAAVLARRHPNVTLVLGHCGLFEHWREAIAAMDYAENLWGCLCGPQVTALREIVRRCDLDRLVWGSDHGFASELVGYRLEMLDLVGLSDAQREAILSVNPRRLLGLM